MTYTTRPSIKPTARSRRTYALLLALATGPALIAVSCSDDAEPDPVGTAGAGGSSAGSGGSAAGGSAAGGSASGGSAGSGTAGAGGSSAGSAGSEGMAGNAGSVGLPDAGGGDGDAFTLSSPAFDDVEGCGPDEDAEVCDLFPDENTGLNGAANVSPELNWTDVPAGTQSFAIAFHDLSNLDDDTNDPFTHWVMWNIPASSNGLPAELPEGLEPGVPDANTRQVSFRGNNAFAGSGAAGNVYEFVLYALSTPTIDPETEDPDAVEQFIEELDDSILGTATLRARSTPNDD